VRCPLPERGSGSLVFPTSPLTSSRYRVGLRGIPPPALATTRRLWRADLPLPTVSPKADPHSAPHAPWDHRNGLFYRVSTECPLLRHPSGSSTPRLRRVLRPVDANRRACSARVVSHHLDGLLRTGGRRFVAPCSQTWGSLRFRRLTAGPARKPARQWDAFPTTESPLEEYPPPIAVPRHRGPLPSCRYHSIRT
jgi:hypothetical protein